MTSRFPAILLAATVSAACDGPQSALDVAGTDAQRIAHLFNVMMAGAVVIWTIVVAAAVYAMRVGGERHTEREANLFVVGGGVVLPTVVLAALLLYGLPVLPQVMTLAPEGAMRIQVTAKQWWWRVEYLTAAGPVETANEIRLPVGQRVELQLSSPDVIHSFWVPSIAGKMDMIPGRITRLALEPTRTGVFSGVCAEYCGTSHALMAFDVVVSDVEEFQRWLDVQAQPADAASAPGREAFFAHGCTACHAIRGTPAAARIGPDLTHIAGRLRIGAGTLPNDGDSLARWISQTDRIKPGVHMPAFRALAPEAVTALATYLSTLR